MQGSYNGTPASTWNLWTEQPFANYAALGGTYTTGAQWSGNTVIGSTVGYGADATTSQPTTWIAVGETAGTFDPTSRTWQTITTGPAIETTTFLAMLSTTDGLAKLQQLNFPCAEVGKVTLTGTAPYNVTMADVKFLSYQGGQAPVMWATAGVTGSGVSSTPVGQTVALSGGGLSANWNMQVWNTASNAWLATVTNGVGNLSGGAQPYAGYINFQGVGAGRITGASTFSGTASGVAKAAVAP